MNEKGLETHLRLGIGTGSENPGVKPGFSLGLGYGLVVIYPTQTRTPCTPTRTPPMERRVGAG